MGEKRSPLGIYKSCPCTHTPLVPWMFKAGSRSSDSRRPLFGGHLHVVQVHTKCSMRTGPVTSSNDLYMLTDLKFNILPKGSAEADPITTTSSSWMFSCQNYSSFIWHQRKEWRKCEKESDGAPGIWFRASLLSSSKGGKKALRAFFIWQICAANSGFTAEHSQGTSSAIQGLAALPCAWWIALKWRHYEKYQLSRYTLWISMAEQYFLYPALFWNTLHNGFASSGVCWKVSHVISKQPTLCLQVKTSIPSSLWLCSIFSLSGSSTLLPFSQQIHMCNFQCQIPMLWGKGSHTLWYQHTPKMINEIVQPPE